MGKGIMGHMGTVPHKALGTVPHGALGIVPRGAMGTVPRMSITRKGTVPKKKEVEYGIGA